MTNNTKTALITGASSGIGKALASEFAKDRYNLVLAARSVAKMQALADGIEKRYKVEVTVIGADLETNDGAARLHADIKARGITLSQADCLAFVHRRNIVETVFLNRHSCFQPIAFFCLQFNLLAVVQYNHTTG